MALSIQSNMASKAIQNQLGRTNNDLSVALERLGSGFKINSAKDDAAGLQIANRLNAQVRGQEAAIYNSNNAMSMLQTAEGAFEEMTNIAYRMKELATQGANGTNNTSEYTALSSEFGALSDELTNILSNTSYGSGTKLLDETDGKLQDAVTFQIGATGAETLEVDISTQLGNITTAMTATEFAAGFASGDVAQDQTDAKAIMGQVDTLLNAIGAARSELGASMNRLDHSINNVTNMMENTQSAAGQLMDADFAKETSNMTKQQLLMNSGISVLSASNSTTQMIGSLLR
ncbi:flagellin [Rheinheimera hassiensis]|uniref:flagellin N-terminal helical domain-containing protein n=1 Tax=Rheinheimera hassiensis TaxID=1193627 RepID=UPI001F06452A|nr:flagellin [Rheinheimera hassiensis]